MFSLYQRLCLFGQSFSLLYPLCFSTRFLSFGTADVLDQIILYCGARSCALQNVQQHPQPLPTRLQQCPFSSLAVTAKSVSKHARRLWGSRVTQLKTDALLHLPSSFVMIPPLFHTHTFPYFHILSTTASLLGTFLQSFFEKSYKTSAHSKFLLPLQFRLFSCMKRHFSGFPLHLWQLHFGLLYQPYSLGQ